MKFKHTLVIVGGGPSVDPRTLQILRDRREEYDTLAINRSAFRVLGEPTFAFSADPYWMHNNQEKVGKLDNSEVIFAAPITLPKEKEHRLHLDIRHRKLLRYDSPTFILRQTEASAPVASEVSPDSGRHSDWRDLPRVVGFDGNSGFAALNFATQIYKNVILLGYDMTPGHWHGGYTNSLAERIPLLYSLWAERLNSLASLIKTQAKIFNCSENSLITEFQQPTFTEALDTCLKKSS